jgi:hypothetical protein
VTFDTFSLSAISFNVICGAIGFAPYLTVKVTG